MDNRDIHSALVRWLSTRTELLVIKAYESGALPSLPYLMVNFLGQREIRAHPQDFEYAEDLPSERVMARPVIDSEWHFSIHAYGDYPSDILRPLVSAAHLAQVNEPLMPGLIIHEISQVRNVPEYVNDEWEPRAQIDLFLRGLTRDGHLIDTIETFEPFRISRA